MEVVALLDLSPEVVFFFDYFSIILFRLAIFLNDFVKLSNYTCFFASKMRSTLAYSKSFDCGYYHHFVWVVWNLCLDLDESFKILAQGPSDLLLEIEQVYVHEASWLESLEVYKYICFKLIP